MRLPGFVGPSYVDRTSHVDIERSVNLYPERVEGHGSVEAILRKAPGKRTFVSLPDGPVRAMWAQDGRAFCVAGTMFLELQAGGTATYRGTVAADGHPAWVTSNGQGANQVFIVSGGSGYLWNPVTSTFSAIASNFPSGARGAEFLGGYFITQGGVAAHASDLLVGATWGASSKAQRSIASDDLQRVIVDEHRILWYIGSKTSEPWFDNGLSPFAFTPVPSAFMGHGTCAPASVARFENSLFMLAQSEHASRYAIMVGNGFTAVRVSTTAVEQAWSRYTTVSDAITTVYGHNGHAFAMLTFPTEGATWVFDASTKLWHERGRWNTLTGAYEADLGVHHCFAFGKHLVGSRTGAAVYELSDTTYDDAGGPLRWLRRSPHVAAERPGLIYDRFELVCQAGVGLATGQGSDPQVALRWSDDAGTTWSPELWRSMGAVGRPETMVEWKRLGQCRARGQGARYRTFEVSGTDPVATVLLDALVDVR